VLFVFFVVKKTDIPRTLKTIWYYTDPILVFFGTEIAYAPKQFFQPVCGVFQAKNG